MAISNNSDVTILVNSCDAYADVLFIFFEAYKKYGKQINFPIVVNTESNSYSLPATFANFPAKDGIDKWGERFLSALSQIESEYILVLYDDFILEDKIDSHGIQNAINYLKHDEEVAVVYLIDLGLGFVENKIDSEFSLLRNKSQYKLNSAPAIWRKSDLIKYTGPNDTPWAWEVFGTYRSWNDGRKFLARSSGYKPVYPYDFRRGGAIYRGKWVKAVIEKISIDLHIKLNWDQRGFATENEDIKRSLFWKLKFMFTGFRMVGFRSAYYLKYYIKEKLNAKIK